MEDGQDEDEIIDMSNSSESHFPNHVCVFAY